MKKKTWLIIAGYLAIIAFTLAAVFISGRNYTLYLQNPYHSKTVTVDYSAEGIVENTDIRHTNADIVFKFRALKSGNVSVKVTVYNEADPRESTGTLSEFTVLPTGVIYLSSYDYGGYQFTVLGMALLTLYTFVICLKQYEYRKKTQFFSYKTMLDFAMLLFFGLQSLMYLGLAGGAFVLPRLFDGWRVYTLAGLIMMYIFMLFVPVLVLFASFMTFSNLSLIRHEGFRKNNLFGIFISFTLFVGSLACVIAAVRNPQSTGTTALEIRDAVIRAIVSSAFVYFECLLFSAMVCTQRAARHEPDYDKDYIIILGCRVGRDGKPLPLLRGRIDRALKFYHQQLEATGKQACFIPSGGKGNDEVISEAQCMKNYLLEQGIDEALIYPEDRAETTLQNMRYSAEIAAAHKENAAIVFSTTNYHVFRSGMLSAKAGMKADGIGAKTKWYFWPNAQMREFIGLLVNQWKINVLFIAAIVGISTLFANISTIVSWIVK